MKKWALALGALTATNLSFSVYALTLSDYLTFGGMVPEEEPIYTKSIRVIIPETEVCTANNADKASCYQKFCEAQRAGDYQGDVGSGKPTCISK